MDYSEFDLKQYHDLDRAIAWAYELHITQTRKHNNTPYIYHPLCVMHIARWELGIEDADALIAAVLHDVLEDTTARPFEVLAKFGPTVFMYVDFLSQPKTAKGETRDEARHRYHENLKTAPMVVKQVKMADCIHNLRECVGLPGNWIKQFLEKTNEVMNALEGTPEINKLAKQMEITKQFYESTHTKPDSQERKTQAIAVL
jgi:(p)ppGpp synthase/HD superfamily hydrolase